MIERRVRTSILPGDLAQSDLLCYSIYIPPPTGLGEKEAADAS